MPRTTMKVDPTGKTISPRFHQPGDTFSGLLLKQSVQKQSTDMDTKLPKTWADGSPVYEYLYELLNVSTSEHKPGCYFCGLRDSQDDLENDNGFRRLYANAKQHRVIQEAVASVKNADGLHELYGLLTLTYQSDDKDKKVAGKAAPKIYTASYRLATDEEVARCDAWLGTDIPVPNQEAISAQMMNLLDV